MLQPTPATFAEQIDVLRALDEDADAAVIANEAYREEVVRAMERVDTARNRMRELEVRQRVPRAR